MKKRCQSIWYFILTYIGLFRLFYWINRHKKIVLTYHNIIPNYLFDHTPHLDMSHSESIFKQHIQLIVKRFSVQANERVLITFDDGYKNQSEIAAKILQENKLHGTYFISFKLLVDRTPLIIDQVMKWMSYVPENRYRILDSVYDITNGNRGTIASYFYNIILLKNHLVWDKIENALNTAYRFDALKIDPELNRLRFSPMTETDLRMLKKAGHTVAAHGWDHKPLSTLPLQQQRNDFALSRKYADHYCNSNWYSYPYGTSEEVSSITAALCEEYGFAAGYTNMSESPAWQYVKKQFQYTRMSLPNNSDVHALDAKLSGFEQFCKDVIKIFLIKRLYSWKKMITSNG